MSKKILFEYILSGNGQKTELLAGRDAERYKKIIVELPDEIIRRDSCEVDENGKLEWKFTPFFTINDHNNVVAVDTYTSEKVLSQEEALAVINEITDEQFSETKKANRIMIEEAAEKKKREKEENAPPFF